MEKKLKESKLDEKNYKQKEKLHYERCPPLEICLIGPWGIDIINKIISSMSR